jgi:hypothetical protein
MWFLLSSLLACNGCQSIRQGACNAPLSQYCTSDCPTLREARDCPYEGGAVERTCRGLTIVECYADFGGDSFFYDDRGQLLSVLGYSDSPEFCQGWGDSGRYLIFYGEVPPKDCWFGWSDTGSFR